MCRAFASPGGERFGAVPHRRAESGLPIIEGVVAWIDCSLHAVHEAGGHYLAIGLVRALAVERSDPSLVFVRGGYGSVSLPVSDGVQWAA